MFWERFKSFQFYPKDWLADPNTNMMTAEHEGAYIRLLCYMWNTADCSLDNEITALARLARVDNTVITELLHCFYVDKNDRLRNKRLDEERNKQDEHRENKSRAGKKGMERRWKDRSSKPPNNTVITENNSPSPSP